MTQSHEGSEFVEHLPCPDCGSSDANALFTDGHTYCYSCGKYENGDGGATPSAERKKAAGLVTGGTASAIRSRKITQDTAKHFGYLKASFKNKPVQVAPYYDEDGRLAGQKVRFKGKDFLWLGDTKPQDVLPFGSHAFPRTGKKLVVTEGELDALAMSQVQGNNWPTVSIPTGASPKTVRRYFAKQRDYFEGFDSVILMFDNDDAGRLATQEAAEVLGARAKVARLPLKDPCEMLQEGRVKDLMSAMWGAKKFQPDGIVDLVDIREDVLKEIEWGLSWPFPQLTELTYGIRLGEIYALGAGTGVGKTDLFTQTMAHLIQEHREKVGVFALEQEPQETGRRLMGKLAHRPFHIPDGEWTMEELEGAWDKHAQNGRVFLYDSFGINEWGSLESKIRYLRDAEGVRYFFLDHLTALAAWQDDERKALESIMAEMAGLVKEEPITIFFISHLATPDGKPHEEGGRVSIRHFKGSRSIGFWSHFMFGMERDQQADNIALRHTTALRCLKDRYTGQSTGAVVYLGYDAETGMMYETDEPNDDDDYGFEIEDTDAEEPSDF